jgi:hypothetical protein
VRRTEISVMKCNTEISVRHATEISVKLTSKADKTNFGPIMSNFRGRFFQVFVGKKNVNK